MVCAWIVLILMNKMVFIECIIEIGSMGLSLWEATLNRMWQKKRERESENVMGSEKNQIETKAENKINWAPFYVKPLIMTFVFLN